MPFSGMRIFSASNKMLKIRLTTFLFLLCVLVACGKTQQRESQRTDSLPPTLQPLDPLAPPPNAPLDASPMAKVRDDARRRGIDFRAVGQEPGWLVEIDDGKQISILADYGEKKLTTPAPAPESEPQTGRIVYRVNSGSHSVTIIVENKICHDGMSGLPYEATVTMILDSTRYKGCGERLR